MSRSQGRLKSEIQVRPRVLTFFGYDRMMIPEPWLSSFDRRVIHRGGRATEKPVTSWISFVILLDSLVEVVESMEAGKPWNTYYVHLGLAYMLVARKVRLSRAEVISIPSGVPWLAEVDRLVSKQMLSLELRSTAINSRPWVVVFWLPVVRI